MAKIFPLSEIRGRQSPDRVSEARETDYACPECKAYVPHGLVEIGVLQKGRWFPFPRRKISMAQCISCANWFLIIGL